VVRVVERILEILDQFGLRFCRFVPTLFAVFGWLLALEFVEEGELGADDVLHLLAEAADVIELSCCGDEGIFVLRHGFSNAETIPLGELERAANAVGD